MDAVVAIVVSLSGNVSPSLIVSPELILKNLASAAADVKNDVSFGVADACSLAVITVFGFNFADVISPSLISLTLTAFAAMCSLSIESSCMLSPSTQSRERCT